MTDEFVWRPHSAHKTEGVRCQLLFGTDVVAEQTFKSPNTSHCDFGTAAFALSRSDGWFKTELTVTNNKAPAGSMKLGFTSQGSLHVPTTPETVFKWENSHEYNSDVLWKTAQDVTLMRFVPKVIKKQLTATVTGIADDLAVADRNLLLTVGYFVLMSDDLEKRQNMATITQGVTDWVLFSWDL